MTQTQSKAHLAMRKAVRLAPVVIVTTIVGALLMAWTAYSNTPELKWRGDAALRIVNYPSSPAYPLPDTAVVVAGQPALREEAIAKAGVATGDVGSVSAAVDATDATVVHVSVTARDAETASKVADALRSLVVSGTLETVAPQIDFFAGQRDAYLETAQQMRTIAAETRAKLEDDPENTDLKTLFVSTTAQTRGMTEAARNSSYQLDLWAKGVSAFGEPSSQPVDTRSAVLVAGIQGAVLGALIGFLVVTAVAAYQVWANPSALAPPGE